MSVLRDSKPGDCCLGSIEGRRGGGRGEKRARSRLRHLKGRGRGVKKKPYNVLYSSVAADKISSRKRSGLLGPLYLPRAGRIMSNPPRLDGRNLVHPSCHWKDERMDG